jgi:hypothetical protein
MQLRAILEVGQAAKPACRLSYLVEIVHNSK